MKLLVRNVLIKIYLQYKTTVLSAYSCYITGKILCLKLTYIYIYWELAQSLQQNVQVTRLLRAVYVCAVESVLISVCDVTCGMSGTQRRLTPRRKDTSDTPRGALWRMVVSSYYNFATLNIFHRKTDVIFLNNFYSWMLFVFNRHPKRSRLQIRRFFLGVCYGIIPALVNLIR